MKVNIGPKAIQMMLPHRHPFLFLDKVIDVDPGKSIVGVKNVTINEPYFAGHFPMEPMMPGVLIVETCAQLVAIMYAAEHFPIGTDWGKLEISQEDAEKIAESVGYLVDIKNARFKKIVRPGDTLIVRAFTQSSFQNLSLVKIDASVEGETVFEGVIGVTQRV